MVFIAFALTLESQYGSICNVFADGKEILKCYGSVIVMLMGIYVLLTGFKFGKRWLDGN